MPDRCHRIPHRRRSDLAKMAGVQPNLAKIAGIRPDQAKIAGIRPDLIDLAKMAGSGQICPLIWPKWRESDQIRPNWLTRIRQRRLDGVGFLR
jgi:hypothetical protein